MDLAEIKNRKFTLECEILALIEKYEQETGTRVSSISLEVARQSGKTNNVSVRIELIP
jgi:hypothetical protein